MNVKIYIPLLIVALLCGGDLSAQKKSSKKSSTPTTTQLTEAASVNKVDPLPATKEERESSAELERTMTIEREYNPIVRDASKINTLPQVEMPALQKTDAEYSAWTVAKDSDQKSLKTLDAGNAGSVYPFAKQMGWLKFAGGNYLNLKGSAGIWLLNTPSDRLSVTLDHESTNGNRSYNTTDGEGRAKSMDNIGRIDYQHHFNRATLGVNLNYTNSSFNYFGENPISSKSYSTDHQQHNHFKTGVSLNSKEKEGAVDYKIGLDYSHFGKRFLFGIDDSGVSEGMFGVTGEVAVPFQEVNKLALGVNFTNFTYTAPGLNDVEKDEFGFGNFAHLGLNPTYQLKVDNIAMRLGLLLEFGINKGKGFMPSPDVTIDWLFTPGYTLFAHVGGGTEFYSFAAADKINRYIAPSMRANNMYAPIDGTFGLKGETGYGFWFELYGGYKLYDNCNFFAQMESPGTVAEITEFSNGLSNVSYVFDMKASNFKLGAQLKYKYQKYIDFSLKVQKNNWNVSYKDDLQPLFVGEGVGAEAWNMPNFEVTAGIDSHISDALVLSLNYYLGTDRKGLYNGATMSMDNINELSIGASYNFPKLLSISAKVNNLLNSKYDIYYGIPQQGINFLVGAAVRF